VHEAFESWVEEVRVVSRNPRDPVHVESHPALWRCVGVGNTAAVFQPRNRQELVIKVFAESYEHICQEEASIYEQLGASPYFPRYYGRGDNFLVIEYRAGRNIYDCLLNGTFIPEQVIEDVEEAISYARRRGLNPADIHVKNVLVHEGHGFLVDVSDYGQEQPCKRWESLKKAYYDYYLDLYKPGLTIPMWVLETIRKWYKATDGEGNIAAFAERIKRMFF
jgi:hypothetical protein